MGKTRDDLDALKSGANLPAMSSTQKGAVPATGTQSGKFLKDDGTWATIAGGGDMTKAVYDPNDDGVIATGQLDMAAIYLLVYPVGCIYQSVLSTSPATLFVVT